MKQQRLQIYLLCIKTCQLRNLFSVEREGEGGEVFRALMIQFNIARPCSYREIMAFEKLLDS